MTASRFDDLRNRLTNPQAYDTTAEREAQRLANRAKYPSIAAAVDCLKMFGAFVEPGSIREVTK
jgi:hypothetical protein